MWMPAKNPDLHGNAPDTAPAALVLIDVINDMEFPGGDRLLAQARPMAARLAELSGAPRRPACPSSTPTTTSVAGNRTSRPSCATAR